ncbi:unnamed protein product [Effrenium voratum]|nr:unnamed protein product [Effrenium voratum]
MAGAESAQAMPMRVRLLLALGIAHAVAKAPRLRRKEAEQASLLDAHDIPHGMGPPRPFGRSFHDAPVGNVAWVNHQQKIFVIGDMDPTAPMDRLDGSSDHASLTGAMPAKPGGETVLSLDDGKPPMAPDWMPSKQLKQQTFPQQPPRGNSGVGEGGGLDNPAGASPLVDIDKRRLIAKPDRLRPPRGPPVLGGLKRQLEDPAQNYPLMAPQDRLAAEMEAVDPVDEVPGYVARYLGQRANLDQHRATEKRLDEEWDRADINKDGVVSEEEFSVELGGRQQKKKDEIERLWQRYHQSESVFMTREEFFRLARTGYDLGTIARTDVASMMSAENMKGLGYWGAGATCPGHSFVTGVQIKKMQAQLAAADDSGVNALKFRCSDGSEVSTAEGPDGDWSNWTQCPEGQAVYGFRSQGRSSRRGLDNAGIMGLEFSCRRSDLSEVSKLSFSGSFSYEVAWSRELRCEPGAAVCGAQANVVKDAADSMGVADLRVYCCDSAIDCSEVCANAETGMQLVKCRACEHAKSHA